MSYRLAEQVESYTIAEKLVKPYTKDIIGEKHVKWSITCNLRILQFQGKLLWNGTNKQW